MKNIINISILYLIFATSTMPAESFNPSSLQQNQKIDAETIVKITTEDELKNLLQNSLGPCAISFHMDRCGWCIKMHPIFESLAQDDQFEHITFYSVNGPILKASVHLKDILDEPVTGYPTIFLMNQGKVVDKQIGGTTQEIMAGKLNKHLPQSSTQSKKEKKSKKTHKESKKAMVARAAASKVAAQ
ncbi:MAG: thioredoxin domain-containing protein [Candidatus Chromulinivorax sp.]|nr:thioredoxin domain-containing protein [Candidatus Chromulinivorax sp.]